MANATNSVVEIHVTNQAQSNMGYVPGLQDRKQTKYAGMGKFLK